MEQVRRFSGVFICFGLTGGFPAVLPHLWRAKLRGEQTEHMDSVIDQEGKKQAS